MTEALDDVGRPHRGAALPTGTVTFLITDIEGSTGLVVALGEAYAGVLERHNEILRRCVHAHGGTAVSTAGDSVFAVFRSGAPAILAAVDAQRALAGEPWPSGRSVRVRMGLHTGEGVLGGDDYVGIDVHRAARISAAAHGGQVVLSETTAALARGCDQPDWVLDDLGKHRLKDLVQPERLWQLWAPGLAAEFPPLRSAGGVLTILPATPTSFVDRPDVERVAALLDGARLVTLTGPGGTGKTRLAIETARRVKARFPDGVAFVDLAPLSHPDLVATAIVGTLGLPAGTAPPAERLRAYLSDQAMLLLLDNFEQVLPAAGLVGDLLAADARLTVLVTSRATLRLAGEQEYPVPPLDLPDPDDASPESVAAAASVVLFAQRARQVRPSFELTADNAAAVAAIARRLDGLPLAIELAAVRTRLLSPAAIAQRLGSAGTSTLTARDRNVPDRQRSLDAVIAWGHDLLDEASRVTFRRLSVFVGGAALGEAGEVLGDGDDDLLDRLEALVDQSLLRGYDADGEPRFRMLATIREYAATRLSESGEETATRDRHADAYLRLVETAAPHLTGWDQKTWLDRIARDHDNVRAAMDHCLHERDAARALRFAAAAWRFMQIRGHLHEGGELVAAALALPGGDTVLRAKALEAAGGLAWWRGEMAVAESAYAEALHLLEPTADLGALANARYNLGLVQGFTGRPEQAMALLDEARANARAAEEAEIEAWAVWGTCSVAVYAGRWADGVERAERALTMFRALDQPFGIGWSLYMSAVSLSRGLTPDTDLARSRLHEGIRLFAGFGDLSALTLHCQGLARVEALRGEYARAFRLIAAGRGLRQRTGAGLSDSNEELLELYDEPTQQLLERAEMPAAEVARLVAEGAELSVAEVVAYALDEMP